MLNSGKFSYGDGQTDTITMFYRHSPGGELEGLLAWHVDDMVGAGSRRFYKEVLHTLMNTFNFGSTSEGKYQCLGWNVVHRKDDILVSQEDYIKTELNHLKAEEIRSKEEVSQSVNLGSYSLASC